MGWALNPYWLVTTGPDGTPGINGGIFVRKGTRRPCQHTVDVPSIDEFISKIEASGGTIVLPKHAIPGVGWHAYAKDTEGEHLRHHAV